MKPPVSPKPLPAKQRDELFAVLKARFEKYPQRHQGLKWASVEARLAAHPAKLRVLLEMEESDGEPDVIGHDPKTGELHFVDCSPETPKSRVSLCYDRAGFDSRKEHKPANTAIDLATTLGIELLTEAEYLHLQTLGEFDRKTSSWVKTPQEVRKLGGALYCERRYDRIFTGHNGAQSYYNSRGFRGSIRV